MTELTSTEQSSPSTVDSKEKQPKSEKNKLLIGLGAIGIGLLVVIGITLVVVMIIKPKEAAPVEEPVKKKTVEQINVLPVPERPVVYVKPEADGRNVTIFVAATKKDAASVEYELEYQAGTLLQGAFGNIDLPSLPALKQVLLGSCSAGGACTYHTEVKGGTLLTRFIKDGNKDVLKNDWRYIENTAKEKTIASRDAKFQMTNDNLAKTRLLVVTNSPGYYTDLPGTAVSDIYVVQSATPITGKSSISIRANEAGDLKLAVHDGNEWKVVTGTIDDKTLQAEVEDGFMFVVIK